MSHDEIAEKIVDRLLYTIEQYTCGATEPVAALSEERLGAMRDACESQVTALLAQCLSLTQEEV